MSSVAVRLQGFSASKQVVVLARVLEGRSGSPWFAPAEIQALYDEFGVPAPTKISNAIAGLAGKGHLTRPKNGHGKWRLTPSGKALSAGLLGDLDLVALEAETKAQLAPDLGHVLHSLIPYSFAPPGLITPLREFLDEFPFDSNVFGMTRFPDEQDDENDPDPVGKALEVTREVCAEHGLRLHVASEHKIVDDLWMNVAGHMWGSRYGIAFFEDRRGVGINYNLTIEVGAMLTLGRRCALLKDVSIKKMPTDLVGQIYTPMDLEDASALSKAVHRWLRDDLRVGDCPSCP